MSDRAQVNSVEAIDQFRAHLIVFLTKARAALGEAAEEKQSTRHWLEDDRRCFWEKERLRRRRALQEAQQELLSAKMSQMRVQTAAQVLAVERAKRALATAEEKLEIIRRWRREFETRTDPLVRQLDQLHSFLQTDLVKATAYLGQVVRTLEAYAAVAPTGSGQLTSPPPSDSPASRTLEESPTPPEEAGR